MHSSPTLLLLNNTPSPAIPLPGLKTTTTLRTVNHPPPPQLRNSTSCGYRFSSAACRSSSSSEYNTAITDFNLYELLGIDASSDRAQIKEAYRTLQKRCHPDIAGPPGHDMAIVLNEAYALLSDPNARLAYDKELAKVADLQGYTGRPIYSSWFGSETERRAVFVDEVKCVGCLKCALFAEKTFAVESVYGRARVVAQWADPENKIQEAIGACPVDCISIVERSNLAALEFVMSKQPRERVRVGGGNTAGARTVDVFDEVEKFQARYAKHKGSTNISKESDAYGASKLSAIQAIQMISNWLYWQSPTSDATSPATQNSQRKKAGPNIKKLKAAAEARKQSTTTARAKEPSSNTYEYWAPSDISLPESNTPDSSPKVQANPAPSINKTRKPRNDEFSRNNEDKSSPFRWGVPTATAVMAAAIVRLQIGETPGGIKDHIGGSLLLEIVNSPWSQVVLAGITWFLISTYVVELVVAIRRK